MFLIAIIHTLAMSLVSKLLFKMLEYLIAQMRPDIADKKNCLQTIPTDKLLAQYDYVIIGEGSAGAVFGQSIIRRWRSQYSSARNQHWRSAFVPWFFSSLRRTYLDWYFKTEPSSNYYLAMHNHQCRWPCGKVFRCKEIKYLRYFI